MTPINTKADIPNKSVCLVLNFSAFGTTRQVNKSQVLKEELADDADLLHTSSTILDSDELKAIKSADGELRRWIYNRCLPSPFTNGVYLLPNKLVPTIEEKLKEFSGQRAALVAAFVEAYPRLVRAIKERMPTTFNRKHYPATSVIASYFAFTWDYWGFVTPSSLQDISADFFNEQKAKAEAKWKEAGIEVQMALRAGLSEMVKLWIDKLSGMKDGNKKRFHPSAVTNLNEFLDTFDARNIAGDSELAAIVGKARKLVNGIDPAELRKQEGLRDAVLKGFEQINTNLDKLLEEKPIRKIHFEDDELGTGTAA